MGGIARAFTQSTLDNRHAQTQQVCPRYVESGFAHELEQDGDAAVNRLAGSDIRSLQALRALVDRGDPQVVRKIMARALHDMICVQ